MVEGELHDSPDKEKYLTPFKQFCSEDTFFQSMVDMVAPREPLAVICHGDCWTNNMLFRFLDGELAEVINFLFKFSLFLYKYYVYSERDLREENGKAALGPIRKMYLSIKFNNNNLFVYIKLVNPRRGQEKP